MVIEASDKLLFATVTAKFGRCSNAPKRYVTQSLLIFCCCCFCRPIPARCYSADAFRVVASFWWTEGFTILVVGVLSIFASLERLMPVSQRRRARKHHQALRLRRDVEEAGRVGVSVPLPVQSPLVCAIWSWRRTGCWRAEMPRKSRAFALPACLPCQHERTWLMCCNKAQ